MSDTPKGYHDAEAWLQVEGKTRARRYPSDPEGDIVVDGIKIKGVTQGRPNPPGKGCIAVKVTLRIPDGAFLPFAPEAVITVPEGMVVRGPIEATVVGEGEVPHEFVPGSHPEFCIVVTHAGGEVCEMHENDPIHRIHSIDDSHACVEGVMRDECYFRQDGVGAICSMPWSNPIHAHAKDN